MWKLEYLPEALKDINSLDGSVKEIVRKTIKKVHQNPLPEWQGGYGKSLGNKNNVDLTGFLKIKLRANGIRIVYTLIQQENQMIIVVVGARADDEVYQEAQKRGIKHGMIK